MQLADIVPWGRTHAEYVAMFSLSEANLGKRILGTGDGPASFNAEGTDRGEYIVSIDPIYGLDGGAIRQRFDEMAPLIMSQVRQNLDTWNWSFHGSPDGLHANRQAALECFLGDYDTGKHVGRYLAAELPSLPFEYAAFDLTLSSHLLFLYSNHLDKDFHIQSILVLCRVTSEIRIFPLLTLEQKRSPHFDSILEAINARGLQAEIRCVDYEFQRRGNEMLVIRRL